MTEKATAVERMVQMGLLFDFYSGLLTLKQRQAMELYYLENWSLSEIAVSEGISRQAVFDLLQRGEKTMLELEAKLGLVERFLKQEAILSKLNQDIQKVCATITENDHLKEVLQEISDELQRLIEHNE